MKFICIVLLIILAYSRDYPLFKQCDAKWANQLLGTSATTICDSGNLISSVAMALSGTGHNQNPSTLNAWLKANKGYVNKNEFVWDSINTLGLIFEGKIPNNLIKLNLSVGYVVIINVKKGAHWVLATSYSGNTIFVKDSLYDVQSYDLSEVVPGNSGVYKVPNGFSLSVTPKYLQKQAKVYYLRNVMNQI